MQPSNYTAVNPAFFQTEHNKTEQQYYKGWANHSPPSARVGVRTIRNVCWGFFPEQKHLQSVSVTYTVE